MTNTLPINRNDKITEISGNFFKHDLTIPSTGTRREKGYSRVYATDLEDYLKKEKAVSIHDIKIPIHFNQDILDIYKQISLEKLKGRIVDNIENIGDDNIKAYNETNTKYKGGIHTKTDDIDTIKKETSLNTDKKRKISPADDFRVRDGRVNESFNPLVSVHSRPLAEITKAPSNMNILDMSPEDYSKEKFGKVISAIYTENIPPQTTADFYATTSPQHTKALTDATTYNNPIRTNPITSPPTTSFPIRATPGSSTNMGPDTIRAIEKREEEKRQGKKKQPYSNKK